MSRIPCPSESWDRYYREQEEAHPEFPEDACTVGQFCDLIGVATDLGSTLRAIDKYNLEHVWLVLFNGERIYYHSENPPERDVVFDRIGAGCIAWDGSDWEYSNELEVRRDTLADHLGAVREDCHAAYDDWVRFSGGEE